MVQVSENTMVYGVRKGEIGEDAVYKALEVAVNDETSPLFGGELVRNARVPSGAVDENGVPVGTAEVDLAVCTDARMFVVETKNRRVHVDVPEGVTAACMYDDMGNLVEGNPVAQNNRHVELVKRQCKEYPANRVLNVSAFVNPLSINGDVDRFVNARAVVELANLVDLLERTQVNMRSFLPQTWVKAVATKLAGFATPANRSAGNALS